MTRPAAILLRISGFLGCLAVGVFVGSLGAFVQAHRLVLPMNGFVIAVPWGALLLLLSLIIVIRGAAWALWSRGAASLLFLGWLVATLAFALESGSGDLAISAGPRQWGYVVGGAILGAAACSLPVPRQPRQELTG